MHWLLGPSMGASFKKLVEEKMMQTKQVRPQLEAFLASTHRAQCLKITQNVASEFFNFGIFYQILSY